MTHSIDIHIYEPTDPRLGRHVHHDSRNRQYAYEAGPAATDLSFMGLMPAISWTSNLSISDQGNVGACVGFSVLDILGYSQYWSALTDAERAYLAQNLSQAGLLFYHTATVLDSIPGQYTPNDTGSDGGSGAKGGVKLGYFSGYRTAFGPAALDAALAVGPVMVGTRWDNSMMNPDSGGVIVPDKASGVAGGHEYVIDGYVPQIDAYRMRNHWTLGWGSGGFAFIPRQPFYGLLADQGDVTVPVPLSQPAPTPTPPSPAPTPGKDPDLAEAWASFKRYATKQGWK